jgi:NADPH2:quinone reductase
MQAIVVERPGGLESLRLGEVSDPICGDRDLIVRVAYAACNWGDIQKRQGIYPDPVTYPAIIGAEVSGTIVARGRRVRGFGIGDRVAAITGPRTLGGYAELVAVPAAYAIALPDHVSLELGAAFPLVSLTAYHLLHSATRIGRGDVILIHAIGGGVGLMATQIAKLRGATVIGAVGSARKAKLARACGADLVVDRSRRDFVEAALAFTDGRGVDLVIDSLGGDVLPRSFDALRPYGRLINIGEAAGEPDFPVRKKLYERSTSMAGFEVLHAEPGSARWRRGVRYVLDRLGSGELQVPVAGILPWSRVADAHRRLESRRVSGKLLLRL